MGIFTTTTEHIHKAKKVIVRPGTVNVTVELAVNWGLTDGTFRVVEEHSRLSNTQFVGRVVDDVLIIETVGRALVTYGVELDPEYADVEYLRYEGRQKQEVWSGRGFTKLTIETGPGGCEFGFVESPLAA